VEPQLNFSPSSLFALNLCLAFIMFGVALEIKIEHFAQLRHSKKALLTGLFSQYILLPLITVVLIYIFSPSSGMALGMLLVAACPGGNASNFFSLLAKGNVALSVTLTAFTSLFAFVVTPISFFAWSTLVPGITSTIQSFEIDFVDLLINMTGILLLPLLAGMLFAHYLSTTAVKIAKTVRILSILMLIGFIVVALYNNRVAFADHILSVFWLVVLHNGLGLFSAYYFSSLLKNDEAVNRTVAIETGIQNSGLGLVLIFTFFDGNGSMAMVAAWWGVWHLVSGFLFSYFIKRKPMMQSA
jgi:bile acid:Na+ symporter, BASS family